MIKRVVFGVAIAFLIPVVSNAQVQSGGVRPGDSNPDEIVKRAAQHIQKGEACLTSGDVDCARREFDGAIDEFLEAGVDLRGDERLLGGWRETIEKINRHEMAPLAAAGKQFWRSQDFEGLPAKESAAETLAESGSPLVPELFQKKFAELRRRFQEKYDREITLTGADHAEHRRLYGSGSAYDLRVRDLTREQVAFIITTGRGLGLHIKDFSTWESVAAHNARTLMLGRPLDTLATGVHLHIDRMTLPGKQTLVRVPAVSSKPSKSRRHRSQ
jgi:hypothetical protein